MYARRASGVIPLVLLLVKEKSACGCIRVLKKSFIFSGWWSTAVSCVSDLFPPPRPASGRIAFETLVKPIPSSSRPEESGKSDKGQESCKDVSMLEEQSEALKAQLAASEARLQVTGKPFRGMVEYRVALFVVSRESDRSSVNAKRQTGTTMK